MAIGLALMLVGWKLISGPYQYQGSVIDPPIPAADFQLTDQNGQPFQLSDQRGKVTLIFFGYTHCQDVCPLTLSLFRNVKEQLGSQADKVRFVFITVDPERDTPQVLSDYLAKFDPSFVGLTGTSAELTPVWKAYGVYQEKQSAQSLDELIDHTAITYVIDKKGNWRLTFPNGIETSKMVADLDHLTREN
jgi:protein SCO1/2